VGCGRRRQAKELQADVQRLRELQQAWSQQVEGGGPSSGGAVASGVSKRVLAQGAMTSTATAGRAEAVQPASIELVAADRASGQGRAEMRLERSGGLSASVREANVDAAKRKRERADEGWTSGGGSITANAAKGKAGQPEKAARGGSRGGASTGPREGARAAAVATATTTTTTTTTVGLGVGDARDTPALRERLLVDKERRERDRAQSRETAERAAREQAAERKSGQSETRRLQAEEPPSPRDEASERERRQKLRALAERERLEKDRAEREEWERAEAARGQAAKRAAVEAAVEARARAAALAEAAAKAKEAERVALAEKRLAEKVSARMCGCVSVSADVTRDQHDVFLWRPFGALRYAASRVRGVHCS
jgi:hypothetical protein